MREKRTLLGLTRPWLWGPEPAFSSRLSPQPSHLHSQVPDLSLKRQLPTHLLFSAGQSSLPFTKVRDVLPGLVSQSPSVYGFRGWMPSLFPLFFLCFLFQNPTYNLLLPEFLLLFKNPVGGASQIRASTEPASWMSSGY